MMHHTSAFTLMLLLVAVCFFSAPRAATAAVHRPHERPHHSTPQSAPSSGQIWPEVTGLATPTGCPTWMAEYAAFHAQQRGTPDARYLVHSVRHGMSGLGDRVRGMLFATRLAAASRRVVLFTWRHDPAEPSAFFSPTGSIDWTLAGTGYGPAAAGAASTDTPANSRHHRRHRRLTAGSNTNTSSSSLVLDAYSWRPEQQETLRQVKAGLLLQASIKWVTLHTNERTEADCAGCPPLEAPLVGGGPTTTNSAACLFRMLFKPSPELEQAAAAQLQQLFQQDQPPGTAYAAAHLRLRDLGHEGHLKRDRGTGRGELADVITALGCARQLLAGRLAHSSINNSSSSSSRGLPQQVLLITDNHALRSFVLAGGLAGVVTPNLLPTHLARLDAAEKAQRGSTAPAMDSFVDLLLLARAECLVASDSGFSEAAWMLGGGRSGCVGRLHGGCAAGNGAV